MLHTAAARFDGRLQVELSQVRDEVAATRAELLVGLQQGFTQMWQGVSDLRKETANARVEMVRWSFVFWIGQVAVLAGIMAFLLRHG